MAFSKVKTLVSKQHLWTKKTQKLFEKSMSIHVWPTYLLKNCPNFFPEKNMASKDPTYVWFDICPKFRSFFFGRPSLVLRKYSYLLDANMLFNPFLKKTWIFKFSPWPLWSVHESIQRSLWTNLFIQQFFLTIFHLSFFIVSSSCVLFKDQETFLPRSHRR